jgi:hypothetical protein
LTERKQPSIHHRPPRAPIPQHRLHSLCNTRHHRPALCPARTLAPRIHGHSTRDVYH